MAIKVACRLLLLGSARGPQSSDMVVWWCWLLLRRLLLSRRPLRPEYPRVQEHQHQRLKLLLLRGGGRK